MSQPRQPSNSLRQRWVQFKTRNRAEILYTYSFRTSTGAQLMPDSGYRLEPASPALLRQLRRKYPRQLSEHKLRLMTRRLSEPGQRCWVIRDDQGDPCGYCHMSTATTMNTRINHKVKVRAGQAYLYDDYVVRQHRGRGLHVFSIAERCRIAAGEGISEGLTTITKTNAVSQATYGKAGATPRRTLTYLPSLGRTLSFPKRR